MTTVSPPEFVDGYPVAHCSAASCGAPIIWAHTEKGSRMPLDAQPSMAGSVLLYGSPEHPRSRVIPRDERAGRSDLRLSHFVTCTRADGFRRPR